MLIKLYPLDLDYKGSFDKRYANGRFVLFKHQNKSFHVDAPTIYSRVEDGKLVSLIMQHKDWQIQWEL